MYPLFAAVLVMWMQDSDLLMKNWVKNTINFVLIWSTFPTVSFFFVSRIYALVQIGVLLVYPVLKLYNGEKGDNVYLGCLYLHFGCSPVATGVD